VSFSVLARQASPKKMEASIRTSATIQGFAINHVSQSSVTLPAKRHSVATPTGIATKVISAPGIPSGCDRFFYSYRWYRSRTRSTTGYGSGKPSACSEQNYDFRRNLQQSCGHKPTNTLRLRAVRRPSVSRPPWVAPSAR
jgi:hypothetical protein